MEAKELMIGNYVKDPYNKEIKLVSVEKSAGQLRPILLTEEWLLKFGFKKVGINFEKEWLLLWKNLKTGTVDFVLNEPHSDKRKITALLHVHQLQNLWTILTGEELTLKTITR